MFLENSTHELDKVWFFAVHQDADAVNTGGKPADKVGADDQDQNREDDFQSRNIGNNGASEHHHRCGKWEIREENIEWGIGIAGIDGRHCDDESEDDDNLDRHNCRTEFVNFRDGGSESAVEEGVNKEAEQEEN